MAKPGDNISIADIEVPAVARGSDANADAFSEYFMFRRNCCQSHKASQDIGVINKMMLEYSQGLQQRSTQQVVVSAASGNAADCLEVGIRCASISSSL